MSSIQEQLNILVELQNVESKINAIDKEMACIDQRVEALNAELLEYQERVTEHEQKLDELKKQYRSNENDVQMIESQIVKSKEKLGAVKTNKEYQSTLKEIDDQKDKTSHIEDQMLIDLDQIEAYEKALLEYRADLTDVQAEVQQKQEEIRNKAAVQQNELAALHQERDDIWGTVESKLQTMYTKVKRQGQGIAMAAILEGVCQVCRMNIPPQLFIELLRMDSLRMCPNCQRIIYPKVVIEGE